MIRDLTSTAHPIKSTQKSRKTAFWGKIFVACGAQAVSDVSDRPRSAEAQVLSPRGAEESLKFLMVKVLNARD